MAYAALLCAAHWVWEEPFLERDSGKEHGDTGRHEQMNSRVLLLS